MIVVRNAKNRVQFVISTSGYNLAAVDKQQRQQAGSFVCARVYLLSSCRHSLL